MNGGPLFLINEMIPGGIGNHPHELSEDVNLPFSSPGPEERLGESLQQCLAVYPALSVDFLRIM